MIKTPLIFVISGKAHSGKDTAGDIIVKYLESKNIKVARLAYAKYIKMYAKDYFGWDGKEETKPRDVLQMLGTNIRTKYNKPLFFINRMQEDIEILSNFIDAFVITDARIDIEILMPKEKFENVVTIRINRDIDNGLKHHQKNNYTEIALDDFNDYDYIIENNDSIDDLNSKIIDILLKYTGEV